MVKDFCAGGLVILRGKLVALKRYNGAWLFPKGHIDPGETPEIAAVREVKEESGITARIIAPLGETSYTFWEKGVEHFKIVQWFLMIAESETIALEKEFFSDVKLMTTADIDLLTFEHDRDLAKTAFRAIQEPVAGIRESSGKTDE